MNTKRTIERLLLLSALLLSIKAVQAQEATPEMTPDMTMASAPDRVVAVYEGLFPEGVEYDSVNGRFLLSSTSEGTVFALSDDGTVTPFVVDDRIVASLGLEVDEAGNRLLVAVTDQEREGYLGIYDLTTGDNIQFVDFRPLTPTDPEHFVNDMAVDAQGNAYVTDSYAGVIYRVDPAGGAVVFLEDETFSTQFALNGIVFNEQTNSLIAVRGGDLINIPLDNPAAFTPVAIDQKFVGADGLVFLDVNTLVLVTNNPPMVYRLESSDGFASAQITGTFNPGNVNPTTAAARDGNAYVLHSHLNAQEQTVSEFPVQRVIFE